MLRKILKNKRGEDVEAGEAALYLADIAHVGRIADRLVGALLAPR